MKLAQIHIKDEVNVRLKRVAQDDMEKAVQALTYWVPNYKFMPAYKNGWWDGKIKLLKPSGTTFLNLIDDVLPVLENLGYEFEILDDRKDFSHITNNLWFPEADSFSQYEIKPGEKFVMRDYQVAAVHTALREGSGIFELGTGGGKTSICAVLSHVYAQHGRVVVIVPNIDLAVQTQSVFKRLGHNCGLWYMDVKDRQKVTVSTWQSLDNYPELFEGVVCSILDEAHQGKANTIQEILSDYAKNVPFRFGCTGTMPKELLFQKTINGVIGNVIFSKKSWELQQEGALAKSTTFMIRMKDSKNPEYLEKMEALESRAAATETNIDWKSEVDVLFDDERRLKKIADIIQNITETDGNTLVLVQYQKHGKRLAELIPGAISMDGRDKDRQAVYERFDKTSGNVMILTYGIASTGLDIPNIFNLVMIEPGKKYEKVIQTRGRGLRKTSEKQSVNILDIHSDSGMSNKHARARERLYKEAKEKIESIEVAYYDDFE